MLGSHTRGVEGAPPLGRRVGPFGIRTCLLLPLIFSVFLVSIAIAIRIAVESENYAAIGDAISRIESNAALRSVSLLDTALPLRGEFDEGILHMTTRETQNFRVREGMRGEPVAVVTAGSDTEVFDLIVRTPAGGRG
jgi:hypothetical protein